MNHALMMSKRIYLIIIVIINKKWENECMNTSSSLFFMMSKYNQTRLLQEAYSRLSKQRSLPRPRKQKSRKLNLSLS